MLADQLLARGPRKLPLTRRCTSIFTSKLVNIAPFNFKVVNMIVEKSSLTMLRCSYGLTKTGLLTFLGFHGCVSVRETPPPMTEVTNTLVASLPPTIAGGHGGEFSTSPVYAQGSGMVHP